MIQKNHFPKPSDRELFVATARYVLPKYLFAVSLLGGLWAFVAFYSGASEQLRNITNSGISTVFGAVVGAITIYVGQAVYERRKKRGDLIAQLPALAYDATATLMGEEYREE